MDTKVLCVKRFAVLLFLMTPSKLRHQHCPTVLREYSSATVAPAKRTSASGNHSVEEANTQGKTAPTPRAPRASLVKVRYLVRVGGFDSVVALFLSHSDCTTANFTA